VAWIKRRHAAGGRLIESALPAPHSDTLVVLADDQAPKFLFALGDELRPDARDLVRILDQAGISTSICSGDTTQTVATLARQVGISDYRADCLPADKLAVLETFQSASQNVAMIGDGVNDAPVLAKANVSFALGSGTQAARVNADFILLGESLPALYTAIVIARGTRRIIAQNLSWAVLYNLLAIPAAASGWLAPWMAAIGMSLSSLLVVANSLRAGWTERQD
jgi:Cu2+-exporting ATPase